MAKRQTDIQFELENAVKGWTSVNRELDPVEWKLWIEFRRQYLGSHLVIDNLTVPTPFPPTTQQAIDAYLEVYRLICRCNGQGGTRRRGGGQVIQFPDRS